MLALIVPGVRMGGGTAATTATPSAARSLWLTYENNLSATLSYESSLSATLTYESPFDITLADQSHAR